MKNTLEYKILKYLSEMDNGEYVDVSNLSSDKKLLKVKLYSLSKEKLITYSGGIDIRIAECNIKIDRINAKIEFKGIEYLNNLESKKEITKTNNFNNSTIGQLNQDSLLEKSSSSVKNIVEANKDPESKSSLQKLLSNQYFIGIVLIAIEEITLGNIYKYILTKL